MNKQIFVIIAAAFFIIAQFGCQFDLPQDNQEKLEYNNLMVYSDLSNRLNKQPNDSIIIQQLLEYFVDQCVMPGLKVNDRSAICFSRLNHFNSNCQAPSIDVGDVKPLQEKQRFVNDNSEKHNLSQAIIAFKKAVACNYKERDTRGLDILSLIYQEVNSGFKTKKPEWLIGELDSTKIEYNNRFIIFTDGYLEFNRSVAGGDELYFGKDEIQEVRDYCRSKNVPPDVALKDNPALKLRPMISENNKLVSLYILETDDRGINASTGTVKNAGDLSDNNIMRAAWTVWAHESGFKKLEWRARTTESTVPPDYVDRLFQN